jgi:2-polyprenyl-3-methyl-5-hydroxy-6-metoxy-1,4-benzoquinol methylase
MPDRTTGALAYSFRSVSVDEIGKRVEGEREFWDENSPSLEEAMRLWRIGPEPNQELAFNVLEPLAGAQVLDFACGAGVTSAWLAARGAHVTGIDIAPEPLEVARALFAELGLEGTFICGDLREMGAELPVFDAIFGQYALHHVDLPVYAPLLAKRLKPGGNGSFLETMSSNRLLMFARRHLAGRYGVRQLGSPDERPMGPEDFDVVRAAFGELQLGLGQMRFVRILDRNVFAFRYQTITDLAGMIDDHLARHPRLHGLTWHRVVIVKRR